MQDYNARETEFNSSAATLQRIHYSFLMKNQLMLKKDYVGVKECLDMNMMEIDIYIKEMSKEFQTKFNEVLTDLNKKLANYSNITTEMRLGRSMAENIVSAFNSTALQTKELLLKYEKMIRQVMNKKKLLLTDKQYAGEAALNV
jgi:hypothetical protein